VIVVSANRISLQDRFLPALLDHLTDDHPQEQAEGDASRAVSLRRLREAIVRDLSWLLNTSQLGTSVDLTLYPQVANSVLNYGMRSRTAHEICGIDPVALHHEMLLSLRRFEPRLVPESLELTVVEDPQSGMFQIRLEAEVWAYPQPLHMLMRTEVGGAAGAIRVVEIGSESR